MVKSPGDKIMKTNPETQKQYAERLVEDLDHYVIPVVQYHQLLIELLERAQNEPPYGASDKTISPLNFAQLREIDNAIKRLCRALECCQIGRQE
jgi:hypothetical protein